MVLGSGAHSGERCWLAAIYNLVLGSLRRPDHLPRETLLDSFQSFEELDRKSSKQKQKQRR